MNWSCRRSFSKNSKRCCSARKFRTYRSEEEVHSFLREVSRVADLRPDPAFEPGLTPDPGDDYLVALARGANADVLVSGDPHLTTLDDPDPPIRTPRQFLDSLR